MNTNEIIVTGNIFIDNFSQIVEAGKGNNSTGKNYDLATSDNVWLHEMNLSLSDHQDANDDYNLTVDAWAKDDYKNHLSTYFEDATGKVAPHTY